MRQCSKGDAEHAWGKAMRGEALGGSDAGNEAEGWALAEVYERTNDWKKHPRPVPAMDGKNVPGPCQRLEKSVLVQGGMEETSLARASDGCKEGRSPAHTCRGRVAEKHEGAMEREAERGHSKAGKGEVLGRCARGKRGARVGEQEGGAAAAVLSAVQLLRGGGGVRVQGAISRGRRGCAKEEHATL